ncbi:hypothetical protein [Xanthomonas sacchari]|uniref:hypothetical protein n=1 Tax=Xanthomonas sacchari TaxID=56458 RepID=UPI00225699FC|nr:hypothetical protein [Xanthomonas sacchari]MCW0464644.1 hypothetical protein [Xanthomonas sacchari]
MKKALSGSMLAVLVALGGCKADAPGAAQAGAVSEARSVVAIRQILLSEGSALGASAAPEPLTQDATIDVTVSLTAALSEPQSLSLRLIDLKGGKTVGEQRSALEPGKDSAHFEFKPVRSWTPGRHLLEARLGQNGKVFQRDFDIQPQPVQSSTSG